MYRTLNWKCGNCGQTWVKTTTTPEDAVVEYTCVGCKETTTLIPCCVDCDAPLRDCRCKEGLS